MYKAPYKSYRNKYGNKKIEINGIVYDSAKEARRHQELLLLERAGAIQKLDRQVEFELIPAQFSEVNGKRKCIERKCSYIADFVYYENGEKVVAVRNYLPILLAFDHRALDFGDIVPFLKRMDNIFENPEQIKEWL